MVIVDKSIGKIRYLETIGVSSDEKAITELYSQGKKWINLQRGERGLPFMNSSAKKNR